MTFKELKQRLNDIDDGNDEREIHVVVTQLLEKGDVVDLLKVYSDHPNTLTIVVG